MKVNTDCGPVCRLNSSGAALRLSYADEPIDIRRDSAFKAVFTQSSPASQAALSKLVSALIGREVFITAITANEPAAENCRDKQIRFDISCKAATGELFNVEMSLTPDSFEPARFEYYAGRLFTSQDIRGVKRAYDDLKPAYQITILAGGLVFADEAILHTFEYYDPVHRTSLNGKSRLITLELSKIKSIITKPAETMSAAERWGSFFRYLTDKAKREKINEIIASEEGIAMACGVLMTITKDEIEWARRESELKFELDAQSRLVHAERRGERRGRQKGRKEGRVEGRQEGRVEGRRKGQLEVLNLLRIGKSPEEILREYDGE